MLLNFIKYMEKITIKYILHMFCIFPIEKNKITLLNDLAYTYGDSMKYIDKYMHKKRRGKYRIVFPIKEGETEYYDDILVKPRSFKYFKELITSEVIITNNGGVSYLPRRKMQKIISTWHGGGPYKKTSTDVYKDFWYRKQAKLNSDNTDYILSSCKFFSDFEAKAMGFKKEEIIPVGLPRNDVLFNEHDDIKKKVRAFYSIPENVRLVLFAPTFRGDFINAESTEKYIRLDVDRLVAALRDRFNCEWICGIRLHPKLANVNMSNLNAVNCTTYPDMQELLCSADVVVSDYSSLIWDYSFTYKPVFLYVPDIEEYEKERGFYMPLTEWPYPIAYSNEEMVHNIMCFNQEEYEEAVKEHHVLSGSYETGKACQKVLELIEN